MRLASAAQLWIFLSLALGPGPGPLRAQAAQPAPGDTVVVAVLANWPPYYSLSAGGDPTGFAVETFEALARRAGLVPVYRVYETFPQTMDAVLSGEADVIPNMGLVEGRPFLFTATIDAFSVAFFIRASTPGNPRPDEMVGVVATVESNIGINIVEALDPRPTTRTYSNVREALFRLLAGEVDGLIYPAPVILALARQARVDDRIRQVDLELEEVKRAIAVAPDRPALVARLDAVLPDFLSSGEYQALYEEWLVPPSSFWTVRRVAGLGVGAILLLCLAFVALRLRERERSSRTLRRSEDRYRALFESIQDAIIVADTDRKIVALNHAAEELFECDAEAMLGRPTKVLYESEEAYQEVGDELRTRTGDANFVTTVRYRSLQGRSFAGETSVCHLTDGHRPDPAGFIGVVRDVTERLEAEERTRRLRDQLAQAGKMEAVGRLAGGVAHDFNNMLTVIQGQAELLLDDPDAPERLRGPLAEIYEAADRSARLTKQLLAFARRQHIEPRPLDPNEAVSGTLTMLRRLIGENINLSWRPCDDPWAVYMDPIQVDQILANLVVNARDAVAPSGGNISIETSNVVRTGEEVEGEAGRPEGRFVRLSVHDDGAGMAEETRAHIFDPFFTTKPLGEGTGLGMATVYGIARQNGGFVEVESALGAGTSVHVHLPRHEAPSTPEPDPPEAEPARSGGGTILLVEDDESVLEVTSGLLERMGYDVRGVSAPRDALAELAEDPTRFDLLITDLVMPEMDGRELARRVRERLPSLPVLFVSGYSADVLSDEAASGADIHILPKPFTLPELSAKVGEALSHGRTEPGASPASD